MEIREMKKKIIEINEKELLGWMGLKGYRILKVEDNIIIQNKLTLTLEKEIEKEKLRCDA